MDFLTLFLLSAGLAMDAFAVSVCKGMSMKNTSLSQALVVGLWFGGFQALMPIIGYYVGLSFIDLISAWDHWIAFGLLALIGVNMIRESFSKENESCEKPATNPLAFKTMLLASIATSIDALAVGVSFAAMDKEVNIWYSVAVIGIVTLIFSAVGVKAGHAVGKKMANKAELVGGIILIGIGVKILLEHTVFA